MMANQPSSYLLIFTAILLQLIHHTVTASTSGPLGYVSIQSEFAYATARPCAAGCLIDNGRTPCGLYAANPKPQDDIRIVLQCSCGAINACYCSEGLQSSATSWVQSCVSSRCSGIGDLDVAVTSMLNLYGGYCATANVASSTATRTSPASGPVETESASIGAVIGSETAAETGLVQSSVGSGTKDDADGLGKSDIVALAASLGVGIPSILLAAITLFVMIKKRRSAQVSGQGSVTSSTELSEAPVQPTYKQQYGVSETMIR